MSVAKRSGAKKYGITQVSQKYYKNKFLFNYSHIFNNDF